MGKTHFEIPAEGAVNIAGTAVKFEQSLHLRKYTGMQRDLVAAGVAVDAMFPKLPKRVTEHWCLNGPDDPWKITRIKGGLFELRIWPKPKYEQRSRAPAPGSQRDAAVKSAEDYRWMLQNFMPAYSGLGPAAVSKFDGLKGADGYVYNITAESRERIEEALEELLAAIHDAEIYRRKFDARTDDEKAAARELLTKAEADPKFQKFIGRLGLPRPGSTL